MIVFLMMLFPFTQERVSLALFATTGSTNTLMGSVDINLAEVLLFPQNKIQLTQKVMSIASNDECEHAERLCGCSISMVKPKHLGNLTVWFRLTCELDVLKSLFTDFEQWRSQTKPSNRVDTETMIGQQQSYAHHAHAEQSASAMVPTPIEKFKTSPTHAHDQRTIPEKNIITITIQCLNFNETFQLPLDCENVASTDTQIHIECNFLGSRRLKTPPQPMSRGIGQLQYNFTQTYPQNERNLQRLANILRDPNHSIKFTLIETIVTTTTAAAAESLSGLLPTEKLSVPISSDDESKYDCHEIGFGLMHFGKFVHELDSNIEINNSPHTFTIPILSKKPPYQNIGQLDIAIENVATLKSMQQQN